MVPHWSFFVSDMYNLDETEANSFTKTNYYSAGFSYLKIVRVFNSATAAIVQAMFVREGVSLYAGLHGSEPCDHFIL